MPANEKIKTEKRGSSCRQDGSGRRRSIHVDSSKFSRGGYCIGLREFLLWEVLSIIGSARGGHSIIFAQSPPNTPGTKGRLGDMVADS